MTKLTKMFAGTGVIAMAVAVVNHAIHAGHNHWLCEGMYAIAALSMTAAAISVVTQR